MLPDRVHPGRGACAAAHSDVAMGRDIQQQTADNTLQAVQPHDLHDSAHILSGASYKCFRYRGLLTHCKIGQSREHAILADSA